MRGLLGAVLALTVAAFTVMSASFGAQAAGQSFNCKHGKKGAERMVCSSEELSALDLELAGLCGRTQIELPSGTRARRRKSSAIGCSTAMLAVLPSNAS
jgi:uncharacterized protein